MISGALSGGPRPPPHASKLHRGSVSPPAQKEPAGLVADNGQGSHERKLFSAGSQWIINMIHVASRLMQDGIVGAEVPLLRFKGRLKMLTRRHVTANHAV
jgi:hypothetical protein